MKISEFIIKYTSKPFIIWAIFFNGILWFTSIPEVFNFVEWILSSQIYLPIFFTSFVFSYLQQLLPVHKANKEIKEKQAQNRWVVPQIGSRIAVMHVALWLSAVLFFSGLMMSFGTLDPESIANEEKYLQLKLTLPMIGFVLLPAISMYYSMNLDSYLKKQGIEVCKKQDLEIIISAVSLTFFITLSYVAMINSKLI